jgi:hypothetical protein
MSQETTTKHEAPHTESGDHRSNQSTNRRREEGQNDLRYRLVLQLGGDVLPETYMVRTVYARTCEQ